MYKLHEPWEIAKLMEPTINVTIYLIKKHNALYTTEVLTMSNSENYQCKLTVPPPPNTNTHKPDVVGFSIQICVCYITGLYIYMPVVK